MNNKIIILIIIFFAMQNIYSSISWWDYDPLEIREKINNRIIEINAPIPKVYSIENTTVSINNRNTPIRIYKPSNENNLPVILFIHGGAWVAGNLETHDNLARYLCSEVNAAVISIGYLNSPEGKFPFQLKQCYDTLIWAIKHNNKFSLDTSRISVVGDSSGGNMATALCIMTRDINGPKISLQVLINPALDLTCNGTIQKQNDKLDTLRWQACQYVSDPEDVYNPYVSPLTSNNLKKMPKTLIILSEKDDLRFSAQKYADKLIFFSVDTEVYCNEGIGHLAGDGAKASFIARKSLNKAVDALKKSFYY